MPSRRTFLKLAGIAIARHTLGQAITGANTKYIDTPELRIGYEESGNPVGFPIVLLHGFPYDVHSWDDVTPPLAKAGYRVLVPYLRGFGPTRFRDASAPRMAEQAAIGQDVIDFADALQLQRFAVSGFEWGGRAAVLIGGYTIQNTIAASPPGSPASERNIWYQYYFNTERGRAGLEANRSALCRFLWETWSPTWHFTDETFNRTATSFNNPDFVGLVIHSYRHRIINALGDPRFQEMERELAQPPKINVPVISMYGADDGITKPAAEAPNERTQFPNLIARRVIGGAGHCLPAEKPETVSSALLELLAR